MSSTWTKIYSYNKGGNPITTIGIDQNGQFVVESLPKLTILKESKDYIALLTVLETDKRQFQQAFEDKNIDNEKVHILKSELYKCGLMVNPYWSELVIGWIDIKEINDDLKALLRSTVSDTRVSQKLRQRLRTLIKE